MPDLDNASAEAFPFLCDKLLARTIVEAGYRLPSPAWTAARCPSVKHARQLNLRLNLPPNPKILAYTMESLFVELSAGYLCKCWCTAYFTLKSLLNRKPTLDEPLLTVIPRDENFVWPSAAPQPSNAEEAFVGPTGRIFDSIVTMTLLHELGHSIESGRWFTPVSEELACDRFGMKFLLGNRWGDGEDYRRLGVALWFCILCSDELSEQPFASATHPNPIDRMMQFLYRHASHRPKTQLDGWVQLICVAHVIKLASELRPDLIDEKRLRKRLSPVGILHYLRTCW